MPQEHVSVWQKVANGPTVPRVNDQLSVLEVPPPAEALYRRVLRSPGVDLAGHAAELGWSPAQTQRALASLVQARLVRVGESGEVVVDHPRAALERLIDAEEARLESRRRALSQARGAISTFTSEHQAGQQGPGPRRPTWERISARVAPSIVEHLQRSTTGEIRTCAQTFEVGPGLDEQTMRTGRAVLGGGRVQRAVYPIRALSQRSAHEWITWWAGVGEQQRVMEEPPSEFAVFGEEVVVAAERWGEAVGDYAVIRDPMLVAAFSTIFDQAWAMAVPVPGAGDGAAVDQRLLELLALGFKDEAIARYLGSGLRTVRRRIARLMSDHAVGTRFQLGMAAQRRGLLEGARRR